MNPNESQVNNPQMNADTAAASLAFATQLQEQMMPNMTMEASQTPETAPEQDLEMETQETAPVDPEAIKSEILKDVKKMIKDEIGGIKDMIKSALKEDGEEKAD